MDTAIIIGSIILGLSVVVAAVFAAIIVTFGERQGTGPVGRYRFFQGGDGQGFLLDTKTGRLWERRAGSPAWSEDSGIPWGTTAAARRVR